MDRIYIANLPQDIRIKDIDDFFRPFGKLIAVDVKNTNPACAFVEFDNPRSAYNAVQATNGFNCEGYRIQVKLVPANEPSFEVMRNSNNNSNFNNDSWNNRYNDGGNNNNYQGNNDMISYPNSQRFGNSAGMGVGVGGGRISGGPSNSPIVQYPINDRGNVGRRDDGNFSQVPSVPSGYSGDPYCYGLSGSGVQWFERFIKEGYSKDQARERALDRRSQPFLHGNQNSDIQSMSGFNSNMGGNDSSYMGGNNYSGGSGFDRSISNRNMPEGGDRSFGNNNNFNNSNNFGGGRGGFNNSQPPISNFPTGNNSGFSNWVSGSNMLQNRSSSYNNSGYGGGIPMKRPAIFDQYAAGPDKRLRRPDRPTERNIRAKDSGVLATALEKHGPAVRFIKAMNYYKLALRILEKIAGNEAKGTRHPNDARDRMQQTAIVKDFVILYGDQARAKEFINRLSDRMNKVIRKGPTRAAGGRAVAVTTAAVTDSGKKVDDYLEQIRKPITDKRVERYELACAAIKKLQAKSELNEVEQADLKSHQKFKEIFERDMKEIEQKVEEYRNAKNKGVYHHEITPYRYSHYKASCSVVKDMESRKNLTAKNKETLTKHKLFKQEFEFDLKHMEHKLKADSEKRYEQDLFKILQTLKENEKKLRSETIRISLKHVQSEKVKDTKDWYLRLSRYRSYGKFIQECESKDPGSLTEKTKTTLRKHREYIEKYEKEMKVLDKKFKYLEIAAKEKAARDAEKAKKVAESATEEQQNGEATKEAVVDADVELTEDNEAGGEEVATDEQLKTEEEVAE